VTALGKVLFFNLLLVGIHPPTTLQKSTQYDFERVGSQQLLIHNNKLPPFIMGVLLAQAKNGDEQF